MTYYTVAYQREAGEKWHDYLTATFKESAIELARRFWNSYHTSIVKSAVAVFDSKTWNYGRPTGDPVFIIEQEKA